MFEKIVHLQIKYSKLLLFTLLVIIGLSAYIATDLKVDPDFGILVPADSEYNTNDRLIKKAYGSETAVIFLIREDRTSIVKNITTDMTDPQIQDYIDTLSDTLMQSQYVVSVGEPEYSEDNRYVRLIATLIEPEYVGSFKDVFAEIETFSGEVGTPPGIETTISGLPVIIDRVPTLLITDSLKTIIITIAFIFIILYWYSRSIPFSLITMSTPVVSLVLLAAMMVILNLNITITLAAIGVFVLGLGADYGIHIAIHYSNAMKKFKDHEKALIETINTLRLPITASFVTTLGGFAALILGVSPSSQAQGMVLSMGIAIIFAMTFILFPIVMTVFYRFAHVNVNPLFQKVVDGLGALASYQTKYAKSILWAIGIITVVMMIGASQVQFSTSNSNWIPDTDPISKTFREINFEYGEFDSIQIVLRSTEGDLRDSQIKRDVDRIVAILEGIPEIDTIVSPYTGISYDNTEIYEVLTNDRSDSFNEDYTLTTLTIVSQNFGQDEEGKSPVLKEIRSVVDRMPVHNTDVSFYGDPVRFEELGDALQQDAMVTTIAGLGLVFFVASTIYASISVGFLALIPIIIAVIWAVGLMGYFGVPFTSLSTGIVSLVLGVGVDFSIHLVDGIKKYLAKGYRIKNAIYETMSTTGKAIFLSSITTFAGFLSLGFATLLGINRLGFSLAFAIFSVFIVSIAFVPALMSILNRRELKKLEKKIIRK